VVEQDDLGVSVGDVITMSGATVPKDLEGKFFRVEAINEGTVTLSWPCLDAEMTQPYHPPRPSKRKHRNS
jgi:hypothetical protein